MPQDDFRTLLRNLARQMSGFDEVCRSCCRVSLAQCQLVGEVGRGGPSTLGDLAARLGLDASSTSRGVDALVRQGYLRRERDESDRRRVVIGLTPAGRELFAEIEASGRDMATAVQDRLPADCISEVCRAMALLSQALADSGITAAGCCRECSEGGAQSDVRDS